jgi:ubiquinone/menaquinone biosynthesis C-methylase UbiE
VKKNVDEKVVSDFGREWCSFDQSEVSEQELWHSFQQYFSVFPLDKLAANAKGYDLGCGSGRWARFIAPLAGKLHCIDPSPLALEVARNNLSSFDNCRFHQASVDDIPLPENSMDFGYCLGVLHHVPDTQLGINKCVAVLKPDAPLLLYLYYSFDNRPAWFRLIWRMSDLTRRVISVMPYPLKYLLCQLIALLVYFPLARTALMLEKAGLGVTGLPLSAYRRRSLYTMRTDALDRFGTRLEKRFTQKQIREMMLNAGLENIVFRQQEPFWCAVGYKNRVSD